jgi:putative membrane protein
MDRAETSTPSPQLVAKADSGPNRSKQPHLSEHLANERTYLAYLRTAISLISFGITINRFSIYLIQTNRVSQYAKDRWDMVSVGRVGFGMVIFGLVLMIWAGVHYTRVSKGIESGYYRPSNVITWVITIGVLLGGGISLIWLFPG